MSQRPHFKWHFEAKEYDFNPNYTKFTCQLERQSCRLQSSQATATTLTAHCLNLEQSAINNNESAQQLTITGGGKMLQLIQANKMKRQRNSDLELQCWNNFNSCRCCKNTIQQKNIAQINRNDGKIDVQVKIVHNL